MALQIPNHAHCPICQRAIPYGDKACGAEHETQLEELQRKRKRAMWTMYGLMAVAFLVLMLSLWQPGLFA